LANKSWSDVLIVLPYAVVSMLVCVASARALDALSVGDIEGRALGVPVYRVRAVVVAAASLGTAAVVSAVGLIGFVGLIVPHVVRLVVGTSYRKILPLSMLVGAAFLTVADKLAASVLGNAELPLGVVTALLGAPVFVALLRWRRTVAL
jgi:iron complex transport system permease protein